MKNWIVIAILAMVSTASAQSAPKTAAGRADPCAPIGRTADGKLVYSMKCDNLPAPPPPARAENATPVAAAPAEPEDKGGLFRNPFPTLIRPSNAESIPNIGPSTGGR